MGGRGNTSGFNSPIQRGPSERVTIYKDQVIGRVNSDGKMDRRAYIDDVGGIAVEATYDKKNGILTLAEPENFDPKYRDVYKEIKYKSWSGSNRKKYNYTTESRVYTMRSGIYKKEDGDRVRAVNLDVTKAKVINGKTYPFREYLKEKGFTWNKDKKYWEK